MGTPIHDYSHEQKELIHKNIKGRTRKEITEMFNDCFKTKLKITQIGGYITRNGLKSGINGRFKKGKRPWNEGMKGLNTGGEKGWFKKGQPPVNHRPIYSERTSVDGYTEMKVAEPNVWKSKQRFIWEEKNGAIPNNHVIIFGDRNKLNFSLDNLILISRSQLAVLNKSKLIKNNAKLTRIGVKIADLQMKIKERSKKEK